MAGIFNHSAQDTFTVDTGPQGGGGGGVSTPVFPENNAQISPSSPEIFLSAPWNYFARAPQVPENNTAAPQLHKSVSF